MGGALIEGALNSGLVSPTDILVHSRTAESASAMAEKLGVRIAADNNHVARDSDLVLLGCKPQQINDILTEINPELPGNTVLLSIAAGTTLDKMESSCPPGTRLIRAMPNTPSLIGFGATGITAGSHATDADIATARELLESVGLVVETSEPQLDALTALSGSGPAYVYTFIETLAAQATKEGLPPKTALQLAIQTVIGGAHMIGQTGMTPRELINQVTSPGGTTLAGLAAMTQHGFEASIAAGVRAAAEHSRKIASQT